LLLSRGTNSSLSPDCFVSSTLLHPKVIRSRNPNQEKEQENPQNTRKSIREIAKGSVEDPTIEEEESLSVEDESNSFSNRETSSMPNGIKDAAPKEQAKAVVKNNEKGKPAPPITPPTKAQQQNGITQTSTQPQPGLNTIMGELSAKTAAPGPALDKHHPLQITAPDSLVKAPTAPVPAHGWRKLSN
ncbi:hypothetical protein COOONC_01520, partial [Cooperia oncophora]